MTSYFVGNLTSSSTLDARERLRRALMATPGVAQVTLTPSRGEISISFRANTPVAQSILATTVSGAGFELRMPNTRFTDGSGDSPSSRVALSVERSKR